MISRRGFLGLLGGLAVAPIVEPIAKTFFLAPAGGWAPTAAGLVVPGNRFLTVGMITAEALAILKRNLIFTPDASRDYDECFAMNGAKIGNTLNIRTPRQLNEAYAH